MSGTQLRITTTISLFGFFVMISLFVMAGHSIAQERVVINKDALEQMRVQTLPQGVEERLAESLKLSPCRNENVGTKLAAVFAVDSDGQIYELSNCEPFPLKEGEPIPAKAIKDFQGISLFATENPKVCWKTTLGRIRCVTY